MIWTQSNLLSTQKPFLVLSVCLFFCFFFLFSYFWKLIVSNFTNINDKLFNFGSPFFFSSSLAFKKAAIFFNTNLLTHLKFRSTLYTLKGWGNNQRNVVSDVTHSISSIKKKLNNFFFDLFRCVFLTSLWIGTLAHCHYRENIRNGQKESNDQLIISCVDQNQNEISNRN